MKLPLLALAVLAAIPAFSAKAPKAEKPTQAKIDATQTAPQAPVPTATSPGTLTNYYCTIWHEVHFDSTAAPRLDPAGYMPIPHMGNIAIYKETGTRLPRPADEWKEDEEEHANEGVPIEYADFIAHRDSLRAVRDSIAVNTEGGYVLHWLDPGKGGRVRYDFLTIREDHAGPYKPFFAGLGGNLYLGVCEP